MTLQFHPLPDDLTYGRLLPYLRGSLDPTALERSVHLCALAEPRGGRHAIDETDRVVVLAVDRVGIQKVLLALLLLGNEATAADRTAGREPAEDLPEYWSDVRFADAFARMARASSTLLCQDFSQGDEYMLVALLHRTRTIRRFCHHLAVVGRSKIELN